MCGNDRSEDEEEKYPSNSDRDFGMTLEMAENSGALLANMMLMVFVLLNTQNKELGLSQLYFLVVLKLASGGK